MTDEIECAKWICFRTAKARMKDEYGELSEYCLVEEAEYMTCRWSASHIMHGCLRIDDIRFPFWKTNKLSYR